MIEAIWDDPSAAEPWVRAWRLGEVILVGLIFIAATSLAGDWIAGAAALVLWIVWKYMRDDDGLPVLAMALTFQWVQVTAGLWYAAATGRQLDAMVLSDYRPMVLVGLGCVLSLVGGIRIGMGVIRRWHGSPVSHGRELSIRWSSLLALWAGSLVVQGFLQDFAFDHPDFTQPILAMRFVHLAALFILLRRLTRPTVRWGWIAALVGLEVGIGLTGYFAGFRDPIIMAAVVLFEVFNPRRLQHWAVVLALFIGGLGLSTVWMAVRPEYRKMIDGEVFERPEQSRSDAMGTLIANWWSQTDARRLQDDVGAVFERMWVIYYPALAMQRVPSVLPHTNGSITLGAIQHVISPPVFFPKKAELQSDSEMVRKYSGLWVSGSEQGTSIAFGYAGEMYIDFGIPWMFCPILVFGLVMGLAYQELSVRIRHNDLRRGLLAILFWPALYLFLERSMVKTFGLSGTLLVYLAGPALMLDYYLSRGEMTRDEFDGDGLDEAHRLNDSARVADGNLHVLPR